VGSIVLICSLAGLKLKAIADARAEFAVFLPGGCLTDEQALAAATTKISRIHSEWFRINVASKQIQEGKWP
jgi:hypothetical protein